MTTPPTLTEFLTFIRNVMGISTTVLPDSAPVITMAFNVALAIVNQDLVNVGIPNTAGESIYSLAVYNLAGDNLINYAPDQTGQNYFNTARAQFKTNAFISGVVQSAGDEGTSTSLVVQEAAQRFTMANLQQLKTPWGRQYMALVQDYGTLWGLT